MDTVECASWAEFKERLLRYAGLSRHVRNSYIFRGHSDSVWKLESTLDRQFRGFDIETRATKLQQLLIEFANELYGIDDRIVIEDSERLELIGRHHGLPTTVLDWTQSPYVAAYFAFERNEAPATGLVSVWCYDQRELLASPAAGDILIDKKSLVGSNRRAIAQRGVFVRLPVGVTGEDALSAGLWKYTIPHKERTLALSDLDEMMITARTLFQDRDAAARTVVIRESLP